jgi:hypothetical protein
VSRRQRPDCTHAGTGNCQRMEESPDTGLSSSPAGRVLAGRQKQPNETLWGMSAAAITSSGHGTRSIHGGHDGDQACGPLLHAGGKQGRQRTNVRRAGGHSRLQLRAAAGLVRGRAGSRHPIKEAAKERGGAGQQGKARSRRATWAGKDRERQGRRGGERGRDAAGS